MFAYFASLLVGLLLLCHGALAAGCSNVTITNAREAIAIAENCPVILGDLILDGELEEDINLDGVESIQGGIQHQGCNRDCSTVPLFTISSSTLREVNGSISFYYANGLEQLLLPNLTTVGGHLSLKRLHNMTHIDITALQYVQHVTLDLEKLETLLLDGLRELTAERGTVSIWDGGTVESFDGFFKNPLDSDSGDLDNSPAISILNARGLRKLTVGWKKLRLLQVVNGVDLTLVLGGPSTPAMQIKDVTLGGDIIGLERGSGVTNISANSFILKDANKITDLSVPFNRTTSFTISGAESLSTLEFPLGTNDWKELSISRCRALNLSAQYRASIPGDERKQWYWPKEDVENIYITANIEDGFFQSFIDSAFVGQNQARVLKAFAVSDLSSKLDCSIFDKMHNETNVLPADYTCQSNAPPPSQAVISKALQTWALGLLIFVVSIGMMMLP